MFMLGHFVWIIAWYPILKMCKASLSTFLDQPLHLVPDPCADEGLNFNRRTLHRNKKCGCVLNIYHVAHGAHSILYVCFAEHSVRGACMISPAASAVRRVGQHKLHGLE